LSREHNDANMLSFAARFVTLEDMKQAAKLWLETEFSKDERHQRRINKIDGGQ
jgi:ribose 5-phosphate isomerase B